MKKRFIILAFLLALQMSVTGCNQNIRNVIDPINPTEPTATATEPDTTEEPTTESETEPPTTQPQTEPPATAPANDNVSALIDNEARKKYLNALANTVWCGLDSDYQVYAMAFSSDEIYIASEDYGSIEGYWTVYANDPTIYIYNDTALTDQLAAIPWTFNSDTGVMILNEKIYMQETDMDSVDDMIDELKKMSVAAKTAENLEDTVWVGLYGHDDKYVSILAFEFHADYLYYYECSDGETVHSNSWNIGMDYDNMTFYNEDNEPVFAFEWYFDEDDDLHLEDKEDGTIIFMTEVSETFYPDYDTFCENMAELYHDHIE